MVEMREACELPSTTGTGQQVEGAFGGTGTGAVLDKPLFSIHYHQSSKRRSNGHLLARYLCILLDQIDLRVWNEELQFLSIQRKCKTFLQLISIR